MNADGSWEIGFGLGNDEEVANALGIDVEYVQSILRKLSDYDLVVNIDHALDNLGLLKSEAEEANDYLREIGKTETIFQFDANNADTVNSQLEEAQKLLDEFRGSDGQVDLSIEGAEEAESIFIALVSLKQSLSAPEIMQIDTTAIADTDVELAEAVSALQTFVSLSNDLEIQRTLGVDTSETQGKLQEVVGQIENIPDEIKTKIGLDDEGLTTALQSVQNTQVNVKAGVSVNAEDIAAVQSAIGSIQSKDIETSTNSSAVVNELAGVESYSIHDKNFSVNVYDNASNTLKNINSYLAGIKSKTVVVTTIRNSIGTGSAQGTAFADGDWGTKTGGIALGGEVGQELIVRKGHFFTIGDTGAEFFKYQPNDIIFNAEQTRQLFANGKIANGKKRGVTYAQGTAFSSGSGRIIANGSVKTTPSGSSSSGGSSSSSGGSSSSSSSKEDEPKTIDWVEIAIDRIERAIDKLATTATSTYKTLKTRLGATADEISKVNQELSLQQQAYNRYIQQANSVGLSSDLANLVRNGTINISEYDSATQELISDFQDWYI